MKAPFPWFGGKSRVADLVWDRFGNVPNYVEPFFGSGAVLLERPWPAGTESRLIPADVWPCLVTYADEWRGHTGNIYRADNWQYVGKTKPERTYQINGRMVARKAGGKTRTHAEMMALGARMVGCFAKHKFVMIRNGQKAQKKRARKAKK